MKFVVFSQPTGTVSRDSLRDQQERSLVALRREGFLLQICRRDDAPGAISYVEARDEAEVRQRLGATPFVAEGAITIEIWPVTPRYECHCSHDHTPTV
jgi:hypothetical protein